MADYALPALTGARLGRGSGFSTTFNLDASTDAAATICKAPKTGTIDRVAVTWGTSTNPPTYIIGIEGVTNTRAPDGTYKGGGSPASVTGAPTASTTVIYTLTNPIAVTAGDEIAATVRYSGGTVDGTHFAQVAAGLNCATQFAMMPVACLCTAGTWAAETQVVPVITPIYDDDAIAYGCNPLKSANDHDRTTGSSDWPAVRFTPDADMRLVAVELEARPASDAADWKVELYAGSGTTPVFSVTVDQSHVTASNSAAWYMLGLPPTTCSAGTVYRLLIAPTTANNLRLIRQDFLDSAMRARFSPFLKMSTTSSLATVSWTDDDDSLLNAVPVFDLVSASAGSGGGPVFGGMVVR